MAPLYVYMSAFAGGDIEHLVGTRRSTTSSRSYFWMFTLVPLAKYVLVVLRADDGSEGRTFALYFLICHRVRAGLLPCVGAGTTGEELAVVGQCVDDAGVGAIASPLMSAMHARWRGIVL
uniref:K+ potassium transporter integral membrane domain-containing protein n=1 Tax=Oryza meridionalis TaxID=40149 RepID=A0A0E0D779_9ORYZ